MLNIQTWFASLQKFNILKHKYEQLFKLWSDLHNYKYLVGIILLLK